MPFIGIDTGNEWCTCDKFNIWKSFVGLFKVFKQTLVCLPLSIFYGAQNRIHQLIVVLH